MKRIFGIAILLAFFAAGVSAKDKNIVVQFDKFTGKTTVTMKQITIGTFGLGFTNLSLSACSLNDQPKPAALIIYSYSQSWQFLDGADVYLLVDGERINLGHFASVKGTIESGGWLNETIAAPVDHSVLDKISAATRVEMKIGSYNTKLNAKGIERVRAFVGALATLPMDSAKSSR
jgi:hypothetical protein